MFDSGACVIPVGVFAFVKCVCFSRESYIYDSGVFSSGNLFMVSFRGA